MANGERLPLLVNAGGCPSWDATVYILSEVRARSRAVSTIDGTLRSIMLFYLFLDIYQIEMKARIRAGRLLALSEIDGLVKMCRLPFEQARGLARLVPSPNVHELPRAGKRQKPSTSRHTGVEPAFAATRLRSIRDFVVWLVAARLEHAAHDTPTIDAALQSFVRAVNSRMPATYRKSQTERQGLDASVVDSLLVIVEPSASNNPWTDEHSRARNELIIWWLLYLGLRRGELLGVRVSDIDFRSETVTIRRRADDKNDPRLHQPNAKTLARKLPMAPGLIQRTREYVVAHRGSVAAARKHDFLFVAVDSGRPLSINAFAKIFYCLQRHPLLSPELFAHLLRHTWNERFSERMDSGETPEDTEKKMRSYLMGWSETSGAAATYTRRHVRRRAGEASVAMQDKLFKGRPE